MALRKATTIDHGTSWEVIEWAGLLNGDTGEPIKRVLYTDRSITIEGTDGASGACEMQGSNTPGGTDWCSLKDAGGVVIAGQTGEVFQILENTLRIRPSVTGDGSTSYTVRMLLKATT